MNTEVLISYFSFLGYIVVRYFFIAGLFYLVLWKWLLNKLEARSLVLTKLKPGQIKSEIIQSMKVAVAFTIGGSVLVFLKSKNIGMWYESNERGFLYFCFSIFMMMLLGDTYFYWIHRIFHKPKIFRYVHNLHHRSSTPTPFSSMSFDLVEAIINVVSVISFPFVLPINIKAYAIYTFIAFTYNVYAHCGFDLLPASVNTHPLLKYFNSTRDHDIHHKKNHFNYGFYFTFWDRVMGTYRSNLM